MKQGTQGDTVHAIVMIVIYKLCSIVLTSLVGPSFRLLTKALPKCIRRKEGQQYLCTVWPRITPCKVHSDLGTVFDLFFP